MRVHITWKKYCWILESEAVRALHLDRDIDHIAAALGRELRTYDVALLM